MGIWKTMHNLFDPEIEKMDVEPCCFPLFVSRDVLQKEKDHIKGFAPEVAWVTRSGDSDLEVHIAIRPTSEIVMYPYFSKWVNVVRWEFSSPTPFIRSSEFLWQEGHTAFATKEEAETEVLEILELYRRLYEEYLAVPIVKGKKSEMEKFVGGLYTTSVEMIPEDMAAGKGGGDNGNKYMFKAEQDMVAGVKGAKPDNADAKSRKGRKKVTGLGLTNSKDTNFGEWYSEVVTNSEMIEYYEISGCYILRPWAMGIWKRMHNFFDPEIEKMDVEPCCFPLFVTKDVLQKEKDHIKGFAPEVAWVTRSGDSDLEVPIAIRPTSETVMYPYFSKWIRGHRDLPLKLNQWVNVVRWEFSSPTPFIRSREFLWQEGHTAFATKEEADTEVLEILELYRRLYEEYLAVPVVKGKKSEMEKFAGGLYTTSVEAFVPNTGRGVQGATAHCLGQNFAKMFDINYEDEKGEKAMVWQNSWAYSTRTIGVMVMVHGDDKGLVLPPKVSKVQVIVVPVPYKDADVKDILNACSATVKTLCDSGILAKADLRENYSPGWKYCHWEMKGVPLRIEIGPRDLANNQARAVRRDNGAKVDIPITDLVNTVNGMLDTIQQSMFDVAKQKRDACIQVTKTWDEFIEALGQKKLILAPWCDEEEVEKEVKTKTKGETGSAKTLCSPFDQPELPEGTLCFASGKPAKKWTYWGRSY